MVQGRIVVVEWGVQGRHALERNRGVDWGTSTERGGGGFQLQGFTNIRETRSALTVFAKDCLRI